MDIDEPIKSARSIQTPYDEQAENGLDLSLIRQALRMTPLERIRESDAGRRTALFSWSMAKSDNTLLERIRELLIATMPWNQRG